MAFARKDTGTTDWSTVGFAVGNPLALPDIVEHWRADEIATGAVSAWTGRKGAVTLSQGTAGSQPINTAAQINGHKAVIFDGTDDFLDTGASALVVAQPWELWLVFKRISFVAGDFIFETGNSTLSNYAQDQTTTAVRSSSSGGTTVDVTVGAVGSWLVMRWSSVVGAGLSSITLNNGTPAVWSSAQGLQRFNLGSKVGGTLCPNIAVAEAFVVKDTLTANEKTMVINYMNRRYAMSMPTP